MPTNRMLFTPNLFGALVCLMFAIGACAPRIPAPTPPRPAKIALVLGAGASKGFAHIGVIKVLEANKIPVHIIVGSSAGSFVGSLYAYGYDAYQLQTMSFSVERGDIVDPTVPDNGFIKGEKVEEFINKKVKNTPLEKLTVPFHVVATDVENGREVVFARGNTGQAVRASCSIPGIFRPMRISDRVYIDGGVVSPVPVDAARRIGADVVIAVDISADPQDRPPENTIATILRAIDIMYAHLSSIQLRNADVVIRPKVGHIGSSDFSRRHEAILEGEKAATKALPVINGLISKLRQERRL